MYKLYRLTLNLALSFEVYEYIATLCSIDIPAEGNKNTKKNTLKSQIESYIEHTLSVTPVYVDIYLFRLRNKSIYFVPTLPIGSHSTSTKSEGLSQYKNRITDKTLKVKYKPRPKVHCANLAETINNIINNPGSYIHFNMESGGSDSESSYDDEIGSAEHVDINNLRQDEESDQLETSNENDVKTETDKEVHTLHANPTTLMTSPTRLVTVPVINQSIPVAQAAPKPAPIIINAATTSADKIGLVEYESETKNGNIEEWFEGNLFLITLVNDSFTDSKKIALLLGALKGDLQKSVNAELQKLQKKNSGLTIANFKDTIIKLTKRSPTEYSRELERLTYTGGDVKDFYDKIVNLVRKLVRKESEELESLASTYFKAKFLKTNYTFQLSDKSGSELVDLAREIMTISKHPTVSSTVNTMQTKGPSNQKQPSPKGQTTFDFKKPVTCNHCQKIGHTSNVCRSKLAGKPQVSRYYQAGKGNPNYNNGQNQRSGQNNGNGQNFNVDQRFNSNQNYSGYQNGYHNGSGQNPYQPKTNGYVNQNKPGTHNSPGYNQGPFSYAAEKPQCHYCFKRGHLARECHSKSRGVPPHPDSAYARRRGHDNIVQQ